ncbi:hypothetical protein PPACK8108_LOCUS24254 [Phakopsora pachyrhizi]|uniref:Uncharacterized protein n=1 Tax=Phakopsora pachyrhizi TaxID=170000 RepID=A0AAV0BPE1_PHAPC|nr:hypothetical protein PPACK8108_LOCUS24254 [Phakopsora pachyrhizi]
MEIATKGGLGILAMTKEQIAMRLTDSAMVVGFSLSLRVSYRFKQRNGHGKILLRLADSYETNETHEALI